MRFALLAALLLALVAAGCGGDEETGNGGDTGASPSDATAVEVTAVEFDFMPADISVEPGAFQLELVNDGSLPHALVIEDADAATDTIDGGETATLETTLEPGTYTIFCPVGDHRERGMEGTLTVGGESAGGTGETGESETDSGGLYGGG